ncbi:MAG: DUF269 domain-containing protein [Mesorhizobium sp.]|nr:MAG: DUF269 domain-containing protein [Mesorhizobium sp.]
MPQKCAACGRWNFHCVYLGSNRGAGVRAAVKGLALVDVLEVGHGTLLRGIGSPKPFPAHASARTTHRRKRDRPSRGVLKLGKSEIPHEPVGPAVHGDDEALASPFVKCLLRLIRTQDSFGLWEGHSDAELLAEFIITKQQQRAVPFGGDPDPDALWRLDMFYTAVALAIEERSGVSTSPTIEMKPVGASSGWAFCRDVHRFGFETFRKLAEAGTKLVDDATAAIEA